MLVLVLQSLLVDVRMGVNVVAVAVLVFVLYVLVVVHGVSVFVHDSVVMLVAVAVRVLMIVLMLLRLIHRRLLSLSRGSCRSSAWALFGTRVADADYREMIEACLVPVALGDAFANGIELLHGQRPDGAAAIAVQVLALAAAEQRVQPGAVAEMNVAHEAVALERLEVTMHRSRVQVRAARDILGRDRAVCGEQRLEHQTSRRRQAKAPLA